MNKERRISEIPLWSVTQLQEKWNSSRWKDERGSILVNLPIALLMSTITILSIRETVIGFLSRDPDIWLFSGGATLGTAISISMFRDIRDDFIHNR